MMNYTHAYLLQVSYTSACAAGVVCLRRALDMDVAAPLSGNKGVLQKINK